MKTCSKCNVEKHHSEFYHRPSRPSALTSACKECEKAKMKEYRKSPRAKSLKKAWESSPEGRESQRRTNLRKYGITADQYDLMLERQGGGCTICGDECPSGMRLAVDHCHDTGRVRGLLCHLCNRALGLLKDQRDLLKKADTYLARSEDLADGRHVHEIECNPGSLQKGRSTWTPSYC